MSSTKDFIIDKLLSLKIETEFEDRKRGKPRYVKKTQAYQDLIDFFEEHFDKMKERK